MLLSYVSRDGSNEYRSGNGTTGLKNEIAFDLAAG